MNRALLMLVFCILVSYCVHAQTVYLADTAFATDAGFGGAEASCVFTGGMVAGWQMTRSDDEWVADAFTVPSDTTWTFDTVIVFGQQRGSGETSTFESCNLQIYSNDPLLGGTSIWGDTLTNVMVSTAFTGIYRVDTSISSGGITSTLKPVMSLKLLLSPAPHLGSGTYWLSWSALGTLSSASTTGCPPKVLPGRINPPGQMGRQYHNGIWVSVADNGQDEGFNMIIKAKAGIEATANVANSQGGLNQNFPNPFKQLTTISFYLQQPCSVKLCVYNTAGQVVSTLIDGEITTGAHNVIFDGSELATGVYYYRLSTSEGVTNRQMVLVK